MYHSGGGRVLIMEEAMHVWGQEDIREISVGNSPISQFCCKPRLLQKNEKKKNQVDGSHKLPFCFKDLLV